MWNISPAFWVAAICWGVLFLLWAFALRIKHRTLWPVTMLVVQAAILLYPHLLNNQPVNLGLVYNKVSYYGVIGWPLHIGGAITALVIHWGTKWGTSGWKKDEKFFYKWSRVAQVLILFLLMVMNTEDGKTPSWFNASAGYLGWFCYGVGGPNAEVNDSYDAKARWIMYLCWVPMFAALATT